MKPDTLNKAVEEIRTSDAVVLMGAGASFAAGMPLAGHLSPLVWHALDSNSRVLQLLSAELGLSVSAAKTVVGDDWQRMSRALALIKSDEAAYLTFKQTFCELNKARVAMPSLAHTALARLVHARKVIEVISFNWDTLLECAFQNRYGFGINSQEINLWKPHGDCLHPDVDWILPHESGEVPAALKERLTTLARVRLGFTSNGPKRVSASTRHCVAIGLFLARA
jgi:NAD-dependent SIR2 family protein deacetylase